MLVELTALLAVNLKLAQSALNHKKRIGTTRSCIEVNSARLLNDPLCR